MAAQPHLSPGLPELFRDKRAYWCVDVVLCIHQMRSTTDLSGTPSLVNTQVADDVGSLPTAVA